MSIGSSLTHVLSTAQLMHQQHTSDMLLLLAQQEVIHETIKKPVFVVNETEEVWSVTTEEMIRLKEMLSNTSTNSSYHRNLLNGNHTTILPGLIDALSLHFQVSISAVEYALIALVVLAITSCVLSVLCCAYLLFRMK